MAETWEYALDEATRLPPSRLERYQGSAPAVPGVMSGILNIHFTHSLPELMAFATCEVFGRFSAYLRHRV